MINWPSLPSSRTERSGLVAFLASAVAALLLGFVLVKPGLAGRLIMHGGYYYILGIFALWMVYWWREVASRGAWLQNERRQHLRVGLYLAAATLFTVSTDAFAHKVLFDEYVLQCSAWHMHLTKEVGTPIRAYDFAGTWLVIDTFLDKRPYFFLFLVSLVHDLTGYRLANVFALNVALAFVVLASAYWIVRALTGRRSPAMVAVALIATLPLFGQNATGASMELLNLALIAIVMVSATRYLREPTSDRLSLLVLGAVLLAQTRYESVLFAFPIAAVIVAGWFRAGRVFVSWPAIAAPLLLVPYVWHDRYVSTKPHLWQLREGEEARFALQYVHGNLEGARNFFFSVSPVQPNSLWLFLVGVAGVGWALLRLWQARRSLPALLATPRPVILVVAVFALTIGANLTLLMFYYWSRLDEPVASRFALPLYFVLAVAAGWFMHSLDLRRIPGTRMAVIGLAAWVIVFAAPAYAQRLYTTQNLVMHELDWELEEVVRRKPGVLLITGKATLPFLLERIPTLNTSIARLRGPQIDWHMRHGTFREILVSQVIRPTSARGEMAVDPDEILPESFRLETLTAKRFGVRWIRISRLVEVASAERDPVVSSPASVR